MTRGQRVLLSAARGGMELAWRQAWAGYLLLLAFGRQFPLAESAAALALAAFVTRWPRQWGWRLYQALALRLAAFALCALLVVHRMWHAAGESPSPYALALAVSCLYLVWRGGRALSAEPQGEVRFDRGVGMLLLLLLVELIARQKAGDLTPDRASLYLVPAFYLFGLIAMGLAQDRQEAPHAFRCGYRGLGALLAVSIGGVALVSALTLLSYPHLGGAADSLQVVLRAVGRPLGSLLTRILLFLFSPRSLRQAGAEAPAGADEMAALPEVPAEPWGGLLLRIIGFVVVGLFAALVLTVLVIAGAALLRLLGRRYSPAGRRRGSADWLRRLLSALARLPVLAWQGLRRALRGTRRAAHVYHGLLRWGRACGLPASRSETPGEYGARVALSFPRVAREVAQIVETFNREAYGEIPTGRQELSGLLRARRRLRSPRHWPSRLRVLLR